MQRTAGNRPLRSPPGCGGWFGVTARPDPDEWLLTDAVDRWIRKRKTDSTDQTVRGYRSRLEQWLKWCDEHDVQTVSDLDSWLLDEYQLDLNAEGLAPTTIKGRLNTLRLFIEYLVVLELVDESLPESIDIPNLTKQEEQSEERLDPDHAKQALSYHRDSPEHYGSPQHAFLELAWHTGARLGALRGLDLGDFHPDEQAVEFVHRPGTETPLKNKHEGERWVGLSEPVIEAIRFYVARERYDRHDEHGREPLFAARQGRPSPTTAQAWSYLATEPCLWMQCPHGKRRDRCEWTQRNHASKCPSSRSPHTIRTGSITWQLNIGLPIELVAERVNATISVIKQYYDQASRREEFEQRRQLTETQLDIQNTNHEQS